jgi:hypothetical protein
MITLACEASSRGLANHFTRIRRIMTGAVSGVVIMMQIAS